MGWNTCSTFVRNRKPSEAVQLLNNGAHISPSGDTVDAATATSSNTGGAFYAAEWHGWCQVWDPRGSAVFNLEDSLSEKTDVLAVIFGSASSTYGFSLHRQGELVRRIIYADAETVVSEGIPLAIEGQIDFTEWGPDEDFIWAVIGAVTGLVYDENLRFTVFSTDEPARNTV